MTSNPDGNPLIQEGLYEGVSKQIGSQYYSDFPTWQFQTIDGSGRIPTIGINPNWPLRDPPYATGIYIHRTNNDGYCGGGVSVGCQVVDGRQYSDMIKFILQLNTLPDLDEQIQQVEQFGEVGIIIERRIDYERE